MYYSKLLMHSVHFMLAIAFYAVSECSVLLLLHFILYVRDSFRLAEDIFVCNVLMNVAHVVYKFPFYLLTYLVY